MGRCSLLLSPDGQEHSSVHWPGTAGPGGVRRTPTICSSPPPLFSCNLRVASSRSKLESRRSHLSWWSTSVWRFSAIQVTLKASSKLPPSLSSTEGALQMRGESKLSNVKPVTLPSHELFEVIFEGPHLSCSQTNKTKKKKKKWGLPFIAMSGK